MNTDSNNQNDEINIFLEECDEILADFDTLLLEYEKTKNEGAITKLKRNAHSIKGSAGIVGLSEIQKTAHNIEDLISSLPDTPEQNFKETVNAVFKLSDEIKSLINNAKEKFSLSTDEILEELIKNVPELKNDIKIAEKLISLINDLQKRNLSSECIDILAIMSKIIRSIGISSKLTDSSIVNVLSGSLKNLKKIIADNENTNQLLFVYQKLMLSYQMIDRYVDRLPVKRASKQAENSKGHRTKPEINVLDNLEQGAFRTLRVETSKIDVIYSKIQNLESEVCHLNKNLDDTHNALKQITEKIFDFEVIINSMISEAKKSKVSPELQKMQSGIDDIQNILKDCEKYSIDDYAEEKNISGDITVIKNLVRNIRILPIGVILHMFPRMVRDIAQSLSKEVEIEITGGQIAVDKSIIEEIKIPIIHILRNAVDHGIESPSEREKIGKQRAGKIIISVSQSEKRVIISVKDDGRGIDINKIKAKAIKEKIVDKSHVNKLTVHDFINMIFRPGFSTEDKVTEISGRGMGLDIVNNKVTELSGKIKIVTELGVGTEIILDLPVDSSIITYKEAVTESVLPEKQNKTVVIVDDSRTTRMFFSRILEDAGYNCLAFELPKEAVKVLKNADCDLIISDIEMPQMNGYEFISAIQKNKKLKEVPVVVISMLKEENAKDKFKNSKISAFISKSDFNKDEFINLVRELLK